jgi:hypothetical protein
VSGGATASRRSPRSRLKHCAKAVLINTRDAAAGDRTFCRRFPQVSFFRVYYLISVVFPPCVNQPPATGCSSLCSLRPST